MTLAESLRALVAYGLFPAWLAAGAADWFCHRASHIERTSGAHESVLHVVLFAEISLAVLTMLFLEVNTPVFVFLALLVLLHLVTSMRDTHYSQPRRYISPFEQVAHGFMDTLPLIAVVLVALLDARTSRGSAFALEFRQPLPSPGARWATCALLAAGLALILEEVQRCRRHARNPVSVSPATSQAPRP